MKDGHVALNLEDNNSDCANFDVSIKFVAFYLFTSPFLCSVLPE